MKGNLPPAGDVRLTCNISKSLHRNLKMAAVITNTTMGELIEKFIRDQLDDLLRKGIK